MGQEISQQQQQHHNQNQNQNLNLNQNQNQNHKRAQAQRKSYKETIYTPTSNLSTSSSSNSTVDYDANYHLRHKYNLSKQTYERTKILASNLTNRTSTQSDSDSNYAKINGKYLQRSSSQSSDSGIYNSSCHCSSISSLSVVSSSSASSSSGCPSSLLSSKSSRSLDKQKHYLSHHLYIKSYLDILEEDERARAHFKSARPGGIRNYTPKILGGSTESTNSRLSASAPAASFGYPNQNQAAKQRSSANTSNASTTVAASKKYQEDPWI